MDGRRSSSGFFIYLRPLELKFMEVLFMRSVMARFTCGCWPTPCARVIACVYDGLSKLSCCILSSSSIGFLKLID